MKLRLFKIALWLLALAPVGMGVYVINRHVDASEIRGRIDVLQRNQRDEEGKIKNLRKVRDDLAGKVQQYEDLVSFERKMKSWENMLRDRESATSNLWTEAEKRRDHANREAQIAQEQAQNAETRLREAQDRMTKVREDFERETAAKRETIAKLQKQKIILDETLLVRAGERERLKGQIETLRSDKDKLEGDMVQLRTSVSNSYAIVSNYEKRRIELLAAIEFKTKELETMKGVIGNCVVETNTLNATIAGMQRDVEGLRSAKKQLEDDSARLSGEKRTLESSVGRLKAEKMPLESFNKTTKLENRRLEDQRVAAEKRLQDVYCTETNALARASAAERAWRAQKLESEIVRADLVRLANEVKEWRTMMREMRVHATGGGAVTNTPGILEKVTRVLKK